MKIVCRALLAVVLTACGGASPAPRTVDRTEAEAPPPSPPAPRDRSRPARLAGGGGYCRADASGGVVCWGPGWHYNREPQRIEGITDAVELAATGHATCARRASGQVTCFSADSDTGEIALTDIAIDDAVDIAAQHRELCAVRRSGRVVCWGGNYGYRGWREPPQGFDWDEAWATLTERPDITDAVALRSPDYASTDEQVGAVHGGWCALRQSGRVTCWGRCNLPSEPQLTDAPSNFEIEGIDDVEDLSLTLERSCILRRSGAVICTGSAERGSTPLFVVVRPGDPSADAPPLPEGWTAVPAADGVVELEWRGLGSSVGCGRSDAGELRFWDDEALRALVDTSETEAVDPRAPHEARADAPRDEEDEADEEDEEDEAEGAWEEREEEGRRWGQMPSALLDSVDEVVASDWGGCASLRDGGVRCWGDAYDGLGRDDVVAAPQRVGGIIGAVQVRTGEGASCALDREGHVYCWGTDHARSFGDHDGSLEPLHVSGLDGAEEIALGSMSLCARTARGEVRCRGYITRGSSRSERSEVRSIAALRGVSGLAVTSGTACGIRGGRVRCYDVDDVYGEDGHGPPRVVARTITIDGIEGATEVYATGPAWFARTGDGRVASFVIRSDVSGDARWLDAPLPGLATVLSNMLCAAHEGTFTCLGGPHARVAPPDPIEVGELTQVSAGTHHACGLRADGQVVCWGFDAYGEVGRLPIAQRYPPAVVEGLRDVAQVSAGETHTCAVTRGGEVYCWGHDDRGRLGVVRPNVRARVRTVPGVR